MDTATMPPQPELRSSSPRMALTAACGAGVLWGTGALVVNVLVAHYGFTAETVSFWRFVIGAVVLVGIFGRSIVWSRLQPLVLTVLLAGIAMAGYVSLWFLGIEQLGAAVPTLIALCLPPVLVTIIAVLRGQEIADLRLILVLAGAIGGTTLLISQHSTTATDVHAGSILLGIAFSIGSACLYAAFAMVSGRISIALGTGPATTCLTIVAAAVMSLSAFFQPLTLPTAIVPQAWFLYLGVVTAALALLAFSWGAARLKPTALTLATLLEPLTVVVLAALLLEQHLSALQCVGGVLLLFSIWFLGHRNPRQQIGPGE